MPKFILLALVVSIFGFGHRAWASCDPGDQRCLHQQSENHEVSIADLQARVQALEGQLHRLDYIAVPTQLAFTHFSAYTLVDLDIATVRHD